VRAHSQYVIYTFFVTEVYCNNNIILLYSCVLFIMIARSSPRKRSRPHRHWVCRLLGLSFVRQTSTSVSYRKSVGNAVCARPRFSEILVFFSILFTYRRTTKTHIIMLTTGVYPHRATTTQTLKVETGLYYNTNDWIR
jgi:hypothetical protein